MKKFKLWNAIVGWLVFVIAATTYLMTMEPTASFWDCGEFIVSANKLDVGHPPGAPFFMLLGRFFSLFASDPSHVAMCVNALSALASALTIAFLFWTITLLGRKLVQPDTISKGIALLGAGAVGALAYTFSDTFWFSAVEGEVYALSSLFTAVVFWLILKWDECADQAGSDKWLIVIAYLMGLSIGVHLLNLLTIPAIVLVYYFRRHEFSWKGVFGAFGISVAILTAILYGIIPGVPTIAGWFELFFTNTLGLPFNTGLTIYLLLMAAALAWAIWETYKAVEGDQTVTTRTIVSFIAAMAFAGVPFIKESAGLGILLIFAASVFLYAKRTVISARWLNTITMMVTVIIIGYASYAAIVIRSAAETPMDQNSPDNVFSLKYYLNREQYGDNPLFYGPAVVAPLVEEEDGTMKPDFAKVTIPGDYKEDKSKPRYAPAAKTKKNEKDRYVVVGYKTEMECDSKYKMLFPRMHSPQAHHGPAYQEWADMSGVKVNYKEYNPYTGENEDVLGVMPTFGENLRFFFRYQVNFMYWRYFMWNFAGRQNDLQSSGELSKGNWITGIPFLDNARLGDQSKLPTILRENAGRNVYYMLPLILGIFGMCWQLSRRNNGTKEKVGNRSFTITFLLFFLTGLAIVVYLNQTPYQPRERDYAYAGSFYAFCIWIGLGVMAIIDVINLITKNNEKARIIVASGAVLVGLLVPAQMASQNWDDHDRSGRYAARDFGANYLKSCEEDAIIFCNGDNDTFPLWYNIEVEGERDDVRACNLSYLNTDWYAAQMKRPYYKSPGLPISWHAKDLIEGNNGVLRMEPQYVTDARGNQRMIPPKDCEVKEVFGTFLNSDDVSNERNVPYCNLFIYAPDSSKIKLGAGRGGFGRADLMVMEMLSTNNWQRPMYYAVTVGNSNLGLENYFELTGLAYRITPTYSKSGPRVNTKVMYENMLKKFKYGNVNKPGVYIDETTMRMCITHRDKFLLLATALYNEGELNKALEVLDYAEKMLPADKVPHEQEISMRISIQMAELYYRLSNRVDDKTFTGKSPEVARESMLKKGDAILSRIAKSGFEYLQWGVSLSKVQQREAEKNTLEYQAYCLSETLNTLREFKREELLKKYSVDRFETLASKLF